MIHSIIGGTGPNLHFKDKNHYKRFQAEELLLKLKYYNELQQKYGVWATNQNKYVEDCSKLNEWDYTRGIQLLEKHKHLLPSEEDYKAIRDAVCFIHGGVSEQEQATLERAVQKFLGPREYYTKGANHE